MQKVTSYPPIFTPVFPPQGSILFAIQTCDGYRSEGIDDDTFPILIEYNGARIEISYNG
jgi:hypothetical protein